MTLPDRMAAFAPEYVIGRYVDQRNTLPPGNGGQRPGAFGIHPFGQHLFAFGPVHRRISGAVDNQSDRMFFDQPGHALRIGYIAFGHIGKPEAVLRITRSRFPERTTQLPPAARNQNIHRLIEFLMVIEQYGIPQQRMAAVFFREDNILRR